MAGAFTHLIITDFAKAEKTAIGEELWQLLNKHYSFLFLGAVSPDLPYLSFKTGSVNWAELCTMKKLIVMLLVDMQFLRPPGLQRQ